MQSQKNWTWPGTLLDLNHSTVIFKPTIWICSKMLEMFRVIKGSSGDKSWNAISPWRQHLPLQWAASWSVQSLDSAPSPFGRTSGDRSPSAALPDPCGPSAGRCGHPAPRFPAGSRLSDPVVKYQRKKNYRKGKEEWWGREDTDESWNWLDWLKERLRALYSYWLNKSTKTDWFNKAIIIISGCKFIDFSSVWNMTFLCCVWCSHKIRTNSMY